VNSALFAGLVYHKRLRPAEHVLSYRVFSLLLSLDEIDALQKKLWLFSRNRWNLFSFYDKDFGEHESESLEEYVQRKLVEAGIDAIPDKILLSCYPRICGYTFNPLSLFYCLDKNGDALAVLHEVHNTFGERHTYALPVKSEEKSSGKWIHQTSDKVLFVSPFAHMDMRYQFRLNIPDQRQVIVIRVHDEQGHLITASYAARRQVLTATTLLKCFFNIPLLSIKVVLGIHWEALRLWLKKVPWYSHQPKQPYSSNNQKNHN